ncbi:MAG: hypothetical protein RID91_15555 [Azospirillaceae bacterium]
MAQRQIRDDDELERAERRVGQLLIEGRAESEDAVALMPAIFIYKLARRAELERAAPDGEDKRPSGNPDADPGDPGR